MPSFLDDMVNRNNIGRGRTRLRPPRTGRPSAGRVPLSTSRGPLGLNARPSQHYITKSSHKTRSLPWQHDLFEDSLRAAGISGVEVGTKLYVSNLDPGVTNEDIKELFSEIGELKRYSVHYDKNGRSSGSAEVVYLRRSDAFAALKRYNNVLLDGKPMIIEIVGANAEVPVSARVNVTGTRGRQKRTVVMAPGAGQSRSAAGINRGLNRRGGMGMRNVRGGGGRGRGRGRGRGKRKPVEKSADDLDKELENYHAEAMNVS
ncbi:THO complex subunit 4D-like isoform X1 [Hibiscus syriacus]|uniref:THO complex subunit 4D-like isoform X1 n=2 Tax=Hibiscus syriacus TaxID=106335 RepID=UPI0019205E98|nr:THO complex subunit 4D-like isoform X1 [Hibiscus syriacus]XP_039015209.1 THO complex subunit 4D-like isoform X1 [Hibiscus syriacus]